MLVEYQREDTAGHFVVGQWFSDRQRLHHVASAMRTVSGDDAARSLPAHGVVVHRHGADRRLHALPRLLADPSAVLVVHRPERRAVVRLDQDGNGGATRRWAKVVRRDRLPALRARMAHLDALEGTPRLLEVRAEEGVTVWDNLAGVALGTLLGDEQAYPAMAQTGLLLRRLHSLPPPDDPSLCHDAVAEESVLRAWLTHLSTFDPTTYPQAAALHRDVVRQLGSVASGRRRPVTVHRDVHDGQILVADSGVNLLDLDTVGAGEAELDLGNLYAHLLLAALQGRMMRDDADQLFDRLLAAYGWDLTDPQRLLAYTAAALLRLVGVHAMRPITRCAVPRLLEEVRNVLDHGPRTG